ncbi:AAA family ATPase [Stenotrophomonas rhizophila]|uniref:AAA family ATPase n=1 Tax=Stenotrophomonas rhizophila TaxID=216778 RepID=UPI0028AD0E6D|nr:AAA family ATPase [Stenotrophomonas rhizophila]
MDIIQFKTKLEDTFDHCEFEGEVARCEHRFDGRLRSVFFVKASNEMPTEMDVERIQSEFIAPSYFSSHEDARWNHYLVFVVSAARVKESRGLKAAIEKNTSYARKFVLSESEFHSFLSRRAYVQPGQAINANQLQVHWNNALSDAGLGAIDSEQPRKAVIRAIQAGAVSAPTREQRNVVDSQPLAFLRALNIQQFGSRSLAGSFTFGGVNLIRGVNGSGKTSLLEAIEHFLCGGTARSQGSELLNASALFTNSDRPINYQQRQPSYYQQRDMRWYGRRVQRGNRLFDGFARYNFLNADAPVEFAREQSPDDLTSILSRIALGPDASFTWERIQQFSGDIAPLLGSIKRDCEKLDQVIERSRSRLNVINTVSPEVGSRLTRAADLLSQLGWPDSKDHLSRPDGFERISLLRIVIDNAPKEVPPTLDALESRIAHIELALSTMRKNVATARNIESRTAEMEGALKNIESLARAVDRLRAYRTAGFPELMDCMENLNRRVVEPYPDHGTILRLRDEVVSCSDQALQVTSSLVDISEKSTHRIEVLAEKLSAIGVAIQRAQSAFEERQLLLAQLRVAGQQLLQLHPTDDCPLCLRAMPARDLLSQIENSISDFQSENYAQLSLEKGSLSGELNVLRSVKGIADSILHSYPALAQTTLERMFGVSLEVDGQRALLDSERRDLQVQIEIRSAEGFGLQELLGLVSRCASEISPEFNKLPHPDSLIMRSEDEVAARRKAASDLLETERRTLVDAVARSAHHAFSESGRSDIVEAEAVLRSELNRLTQFKRTLLDLPRSALEVALPSLKGFIEDARLAYSQVVIVAEDIQASQSRNAEVTLLSRELESSIRNREQLQKEQDNLKRAFDVLDHIRSEHSLERGLSDFLGSNLSSIQSIFERIHVPNELRLSNLSSRELMRLPDESPVNMNQISTGQRAALVLSIFLTLNSSLRLGPPIMLVDDPVAHIDDMNSLALLDYLADVAEGGQRQIFFATADEKLANLFEKKMAFLGERFRSISLARDNNSELALH